MKRSAIISQSEDDGGEDEKRTRKKKREESRQSIRDIRAQFVITNSCSNDAAMTRFCERSWKGVSDLRDGILERFREKLLLLKKILAPSISLGALSEQKEVGHDSNIPRRSIRIYLRGNE